MPLARNTLLSTASLVTVRSAGVAARTLSLLTLAAGMPAERFSHYAIAFVLSELARCATDFGLDPVVLRRAEGLGMTEQRPMIRSALAIRLTHGTVAAAMVVAILAVSFPLDLLLVAAGMQFLSQGLLQLGLNWRQVNNSAHRIAPVLLTFYCAVIGLAVLAYFRSSLGSAALPVILGGELGTALVLLAPLSRPRFADLMAGYRQLVPRALPMAGIMFLAFVNTRTDALLVGRLVRPDDAGHYLYLARWVDLVPMLATGVALPMVGKLAGFDIRRNASALLGIGAVLATGPFLLIQIAAYINPPYAGDLLLRMLLATVAACRIGLAIATTILLAQWRDGLLFRVAIASTTFMPLLIWVLGSQFGLHGIASGVLVAEAGNLLFQTFLLLRRRTPPCYPVLGSADG